MKEKLRQIVDTFHRYNSEHMAMQAFGLSDETEYDALVIAPSFTPYRLHMDDTCTVTTLREGSYIAGYLVEKDGLKIAWVKIGSSAGNLIDHLAVCAELSFRKVIFIGAVGSLKKEFHVGDVCTPAFSISGSAADSYLMKDSIRESMLFEKVVPDMQFTDEVIRIAAEKGYSIRRRRKCEAEKHPGEEEQEREKNAPRSFRPGIRQERRPSEPDRNGSHALSMPDDAAASIQRDRPCRSPQPIE